MKHPKRTGHSPTTLCTVLEQSPLERKSGRCAQRKKPGNWHKFLCPGRLLRSNESFKVPRLQPTRRVLTGWWRAWVKLCRVPAQEQPPYESGFLQKQLLRKSRLFPSTVSQQLQRRAWYCLHHCTKETEVPRGWGKEWRGEGLAAGHPVNANLSTRDLSPCPTPH